MKHSVLTLYVLFVAATGLGSPDPDRVEQYGDWLGFCDGTVFILYAEVLSDDKPRDKGFDTLRVRPLATIVGAFDPGKEATLEIKTHFKRVIPGMDPKTEFFPKLPDPPPLGSHVLVILQRINGLYITPQGIMMFMPSRMALEVVKGDPAVVIVGIMKKLRPFLHYTQEPPIPPPGITPPLPLPAPPAPTPSITPPIK